MPPCSEDAALCNDCATCLKPDDLLNGRPTLNDTRLLLPWFLDAAPSADCAKGGLGVYTDQIRTNPDTGSVVGLRDAGLVTASFRAFSSPLSKQPDFIKALRATRALVEKAQTKLRDVHRSAGTCFPADRLSKLNKRCSNRCAL